MNERLYPNRKVHFVFHRRGSYIEPSNQKIDPTDWYSKAEYSKIGDDNMAILRMMHTCKLLDDEKVCTRGLEARTSLGRRRSKTNRRRALHAVIDEQYRQKKEGADDPEMMAEIYKGFSIPSIIQSNNLGFRDAQAAKIVFHEKQDYLFLIDKSCDATDATEESTEFSSTEFSSTEFSEGDFSGFTEVSREIEADMSGFRYSSSSTRRPSPAYRMISMFSRQKK
jgi:hypothetical protein